MGCIICNILIQDPLTDGGTNEQQVAELKEEICNDIAVYHSEMVARINEIRKYVQLRDAEDDRRNEAQK